MIEAEPYVLDAPGPEDWCTSLDRAPNPLRAKIANREVEAPDMVLKIWQAARPITPTEYDHLMRRRAWARRYEPTSYHAQPIDLSVLRTREVL